ncbi:MAG: FG-GAP repeat protein [Phycisphaerales bacterium]|nr:FG-GAP repeat protein [Phycisphaerales bacterium]
MTGRMYIGLGALSAAFMLAVAAGSAPGQCEVNELDKLAASDAAQGDQFGYAVCLSGDTAVIGAAWDDHAGSAAGSAYVFHYDEGAGGWAEHTKLTASDAAAGDQFGNAVAVCGEITAVGAQDDDDAGLSSGSVYIYLFHAGDPGEWLEDTKLTASDADQADLFGFSVFLDGDVLVVGAPGNDGAGSAYVFRYAAGAWSQEAILTASDAEAGDQFGCAVSVSGDVAVVGARLDDGAGAAYVYRFEDPTWIEEAKLTASDGAAADLFGASVAVDGEAIVVGAYLDDDDAADSGSAYVYQYNVGGPGQWGQVGKLTASDPVGGGYFGWSVAVEGFVALVGAPESDAQDIPAGAAYAFHVGPDGSGEPAKLIASDGEANDRFGHAVSLSGDMGLVGARLDDNPELNTGSAYIFGRFDDCNSNGVLDLCDIADGTSLDRNGNGIPDECEPCYFSDLDGDGEVGQADLGILLAAYGIDDGGDIDGDGQTGQADLGILLSVYGQVCE